MSINKQDAQTVIRKLDAKLRRPGKRHDVYEITYQGTVVATFGVSRGSNKDAPHDHLPKQLHVHPRWCREMVDCRYLREDWLGLMRQLGRLPS